MRGFGLGLALVAACAAAFGLSDRGAPAVDTLRSGVVHLGQAIAERVAFARPSESAGPRNSGSSAAPHPLDTRRSLSAVSRDPAIERPADLDARRDPGAAPVLPAATDRASLPVQRTPEFALVSTAKETVVFARPTAKAPKLGYLRSGAVVSRDPEPSSYEGCRGGFYGIEPEGFVCVGANASLDAGHDAARATRRRADRTAPLPYVYGYAPATGAPAYSRIPTEEERKSVEPGLHLSRGDEKSFDGVPLDDVPWFLSGGEPSIASNGVRFSKTALLVGSPSPKSGFAFTSLFESATHRFGLTVDMTVVPLDRVTKIEPSRFHGIPLVGDTELPVVFVRSRAAVLYLGDPKALGLKFERRLEFREAVPITGRRERVSDVSYLETRDGNWIIDKDLLRVNPRSELPAWAANGRTWIDVSINKQTLVAYEGARPVFVTLVSTGIDGTGDPETTHSTIQGQFLIHTKHVTATMDGDEAGDEFDLREVPYVQYFKDGFAFHAAYWHDGFGAPRSHGCVNLSPLDARWLFVWTEPHVPAAWHGAMSTRGTLVSVRE